VLVKFQLHILKTFELQPYKVVATERLICKKRENKSLALTKMDITYEWCNVETWNLHHRVCHKLMNGLLDKLFILLSYINTNKLKSMKKHRSWTTASTSSELTTITYNFFGVLYSNKDIRAPLAWKNQMIPRF